MSEPQKAKRIDLPSDFTDADRKRAAALIKQRIVDRTLSNLDVDGKRFADYSDSYAKSFEFQQAGKDQKDPNLTLTGDMLESIQTLESGEGYVVIGYREGTPENDKATWAERSDNGPARRFLGLRDVELEQIIEEVKLDRDTLTAPGDPSVNDATQEALRDKQIKNLLKSAGLPVDE